MALEMKYFVLRPRSKKPLDLYAKASRAAMETYARIIKTEDPHLAVALNLWVSEEVYKAMELHKEKNQ